ncbi:MAG TPA: hypothetical protein VN213_15410 [Solirubrobacteraceae bacterium]|nr:hypothetical protein [Solirubrobacteraceae bacterium]
MIRVRLLAALVLALAPAFVAVACGGGEDRATRASDVNALLRDTFAGDKDIDSGRLDLRLRIAPRGAAARGLDGPVDVRLTGPFESEGAGRLPRFALDAEIASDGGSLTAGATSTGDAGYVAFMGRAYELAGPVFRQFKAGYEQAQKQGRGQSFAALGMNPRAWLRDARNAGEAKVGDADTIKITGTVDVPALLDDVERALERARALGGAGRLPERLGPAKRRAAERAVRDARVEIYTGRDDRILRRLHVDLRLAGERGARAAVTLDLSLTEVNEGQDISAPSDPRPFSELTNRLGGLGFALGGGAGGSGSGAAPGGSALQRYADCVDQAAGDATRARRCARLLTP